MFSSFVFYILAPAIILVNCQEFQHEERGPHENSPVENCTAVIRQIRDNRYNASLMARPRHVILIPRPGFEYQPTTVMVNRCNGNCADRFSPMPEVTRKKGFVVLERPEGSYISDKCVTVQVDEHVKCKCKCMRDAKVCTSLQEWNQASCTCPCKDRKIKKPQCERTSGVWNDMTCHCQKS